MKKRKKSIRNWVSWNADWLAIVALFIFVVVFAILINVVMAFAVANTVKLVFGL